MNERMRRQITSSPLYRSEQARVACEHHSHLACEFILQFLHVREVYFSCLGLFYVFHFFLTNKIDLSLMILGATYHLFVYSRYCPSSGNSDENMVQGSSPDSSLRVMGLLVAISFGVIGLLFLYVLYNMTINIAGTATIAILFFIALAFIAVFMKTLKMMNKLTAASASTNDLEQASGIATIADLINQAQSRRDSLPPPYEEAVKNYARSDLARTGSLPKYCQSFECPRCSFSIQNISSTSI